MYTSVDLLKSIVNDEDSISDYYRRILTVNDTDIKRHYLSMELNKYEFNDERYYALHQMNPNDYVPFYSPQINK